jgi:hypothetical protein
MSTLGKHIAFAASHIGNIRVFALWGILDALVYLIAKDSRIKSIAIYLIIFITITVLAFYMPSIMEYL